MTGESLCDRHVRQLIRADFRRGEAVSVVAGASGSGARSQTLSDYLRGGPRARLADRACTLTVAVWFVLLPVLSLPIGIASGLSLGLWLAWAAITPLMFYLGLREFAGWRCMRRLRHRARR